ncbi:hypothetical protein a10_08569 [Streptomyces acidiscabies]|nr:hypothetical protein a10_08569 [Streptomyces acidiscabies]
MYQWRGLVALTVRSRLSAPFLALGGVPAGQQTLKSRSDRPRPHGFPPSSGLRRTAGLSRGAPVLSSSTRSLRVTAYSCPPPHVAPLRSPPGSGPGAGGRNAVGVWFGPVHRLGGRSERETRSPRGTGWWRGAGAGASRSRRRSEAPETSPRRPAYCGPVGCDLVAQAPKGEPEGQRTGWPQAKNPHTTPSPQRPKTAQGREGQRVGSARAGGGSWGELGSSVGVPLLLFFPLQVRHG